LNSPRGAGRGPGRVGIDTGGAPRRPGARLAGRSRLYSSAAPRLGPTPWLPRQAPARIPGAGAPRTGPPSTPAPRPMASAPSRGCLPPDRSWPVARRLRPSDRRLRTRRTRR